jgi:undecaprenyl diphosphate synthase
MTIPNHIAIIMDGNGRWAKSKGLPRTAGHAKGAETLRKIIAQCSRQGVGYLTIFAFSAENWQRPKAEVGFLMELLSRQLKSQIGDLHKNGIRLKVIGERNKLNGDIKKDIENAEKLTAKNKGLVLQIGLSYGSRQELAQAVKKSQGDVGLFEKSLYTQGVPDPDLLIRTGGERRVSNFLLWQIAYTELYFSDKLWPEFTKKDLQAAIKDYSRRERRYGK